MSACTNSTIATASRLRMVLRWRIQTERVSQLWSRISTPKLVAYCGLALAVVLWGFGYKLSLYHRHPTPIQHVDVAKFWLEQSNCSIDTAQNLRRQFFIVAGPQALGSTFSWLPRLNRAALCTATAQRAALLTRRLSISPRSPPPQNFLTA